MSDLGAWRLIAFAALAAFATLHWFTLLADPPLARAILLVAIVVAGSALLLAIGASSLAGRRTRSAVVALWCLSGLVALLTLAAGLLAAGLPLRLLPPWHWGELGTRLDPALGRLDELGVPYAGDATWVRRAILFGAPVLLTLAAALAFWPARRARTRSALRLAGLVALLALFGIAVAWDSRGAELPLGLALLGLIAAWLWLPRLATRRSAAIGFATVGLAAAMALPASAALDGDRAWWDYRAWNLLSDGAPASFRWEHSYGPLDWPRDGTTLLRVRSDEARYWKAEVLDSFDGRRWQRAPLEESPAQSAFARYGQADAETHPGWLERADFEIGELRSELVFAPGTAERTSISLSPSADGTTTTGADPLTSGDVYTVEAYVPDPTQAQLRGADRSYSRELAPYTSLELPLEESGGGGETTVSVPPWGSGLAGAAAERQIAAGPYAAVGRLARRLTDEAASPHAAVVAIQRHLESRYSYSEDPPERQFPLASFLFEDRLGYCQQFSGAMALMLRMVGIPSRVVAGFAPGIFSGAEGAFRVTDFDAHSWVEVYFEEIGWVVFDPTPSIAPPELQFRAAGGLSANAAATGPDQIRSQADPADRRRPVLRATRRRR